MNNLKQVIEIIGQGVFDLFPDRDKVGTPLKKEYKDATELVGKFINLAEQAYVLIQWPESQEYMEEEWFDKEAILDVDGESGSAYFIPLKYLL
jgi:hypothetical protein